MCKAYIVHVRSTLVILSLILRTAVPTFAQTNCPNVETNPANNGSDVAISATAVSVWPANSRVCTGVIVNVGANDIKCRSMSEGLPTSTVGQTIKPSASFNLEQSARHEWRCIRVVDDSLVSVTREKQ